MTCTTTEGGHPATGIDLTTQAVLQGRVTRAGQPVGNAYVRLLDSTGEFTGEVPTDRDGSFRFFAREGEWTLRALAPATGAPREITLSDTRVSAVLGAATDVAIHL